MSEIVPSNASLSTSRTPNLIAAEINNIKEQTRKMVLYNSIEIGRRLIEAKEMLNHGEWGNWLKESVDYSQSTANNLMKIFNEYGADQITLLGDNAKSQAFGNLSYSQAVALLGIPQEERETFAKENDVENMSTRELQKAIKERDEALETLKTANEIANEKTEEAKLLLDEKFKIESELRTTDEVLRDTQKKFQSVESAWQCEKDKSIKAIAENKRLLTEAQNSGNNGEVEKLQASLNEKERALEESNKKIEELELELKAPMEAVVVEKVPEEVEKELQELREKVNKSANVSTIKFKVHFEKTVASIKDLLGALAEIKEKDTEEYAKYKKGVTGLLNKMVENL